MIPGERGGPSGDGWPEISASHADLSPADLAFRKLARREPAYLDRSTFTGFDRGNPLLKHRLQSWPTFVGRTRMREIEEATLSLSRLIRSIPERLFGNDAKRMAAFYGTDEASMLLAVTLPNGISGALARADFVRGASGFKCLELNVSGHLGGWETVVLAEMMLSVLVVKSFIEERGVRVSFRNTLRILLAHIAREALEHGLLDGRRIDTVVGLREGPAVVRDPMILGFLGREYRAALQEVDSSLDGSIAMSDYSDLEERGGALYLSGRRVHALVERHVGGTEGTCFRCFKKGNLSLYNGPMSQILSDKRNLALLSEGLDSDLFDAEEKRAISDHLPWTRRLLPGEVTRDGERVRIESLVRERREEMVIKKAGSLGGHHVVIGRFKEQDEWDAAVSQAVGEGDWIVQEYVESRPYLYQAGAQGCTAHDLVWGPFVFGSTFGGVILRVQPKALHGVVNAALGATEGIVFEVDDEEIG